MWRSFHDAWWRLARQRQPRSVSDTLACSFLHSGALVYRAAVAFRNTAYDRGWLRQVRLPVPVVSVGNLTVGGTGKTACVELIARTLMAQGVRVAILSRGYGGVRRSYWLRWQGGELQVNGQLAACRDGLADEPQVLAMHLEGVPVLVGARRDRTGRLACTQFGAQTVILDDGFQHRRLRRDCEIVLVHARMPLGGWAVLPRGPMREPLSALSRAHIVIMTKADEALETLGALGERLRSLNPEALLVTAVHEPTALCEAATGTPCEPAHLHGLRVGLLSSIGDPEGFEATVQRLGATVAWHVAWPDHYRYYAGDWHRLLARVRGSRVDAVVTTEKDWVRLHPALANWDKPAVPLWVIKVQMKLLSGEAELDDRLARLYAR